jgi:predicted CDP-diglyceride synthetase/phosphatidate cytidylyltransferase
MLCSLQLAFLSIKVFRFLIAVLSCRVNKKLNIQSSNVMYSWKIRVKNISQICYQDHLDADDLQHLDTVEVTYG